MKLLEWLPCAKPILRPLRHVLMFIDLKTLVGSSSKETSRCKRGPKRTGSRCLHNKGYSSSTLVMIFSILTAISRLLYNNDRLSMQSSNPQLPTESLNHNAMAIRSLMAQVIRLCLRFQGIPITLLSPLKQDLKHLFRYLRTTYQCMAMAAVMSLRQLISTML